MNIFSCLLVAAFAYNLVKKKSAITKLIDQTAITVYIYLFVNAGFFFTSDLINIDYWQGALLLEFVLVLLLFRERHFTKRLMIYIGCLLASVILLLVIPSRQAKVVGDSGLYQYYMVGAAEYERPEFSKFTFFYLVLAVIQAYVFVVISRRVTTENIMCLIKKLSGLIKVSIVIWIVEFFTKNVMSSSIYNDALTFFFGEGTSMLDTLQLRGEYYSLQGFVREPSQFAYVLAYGIIVLYTEQIINEKRKNTIWILIMALFIFTSGAFSSLLSIAFLFVLYLLYKVYITGKKGSNIYKTILLFALAIVVCFFSVSFISTLSRKDGYMSIRLNETFDVLKNILKLDMSYFNRFPALGSSVVRIYSVIHSLSNWILRPIFGLGIATTFCHGSTALTLAEVGVSGVWSYLALYFSFSLKDKRYRTVNRFVILSWIVINLLAGCGTRYIVMIDGCLLLMCFWVVEQLKNKRLIKQG